MSTKKKAPPDQNLVKDYQGNLWVVRRARATSHGFTIELGYPQATEGRKRASVILTPRLAAHIRKYPHHQKAALPLSSPTLYRLMKRLNAIPRVADIEGKEWEVIRERIASSGTSLIFGKLCGDNKRPRIVLTHALSDYLLAQRQAGVAAARVALNLGLISNTVKRFYTQLSVRAPEVMDIEGRRCYIRTQYPTEHGFYVLRGARVESLGKSSSQKEIILTPPLMNHIACYPNYEKANLPMVSLAWFQMILKRYQIQPQITDAEGREWFVHREKPTPHGFSIYQGSRVDDPSNCGFEAIPTRALIDFMRDKLKEGVLFARLDLPIDPMVMARFVKQFELEQKKVIVKDIEGIEWTVHQRIPTEYGFEMFKGTAGKLRTFSIVLTRELVSFIERELKAGALFPELAKKLSVRLVTLRLFLHRAGIKNAEPTMKDREGALWEVYERRPTRYGFDIFWGRLVVGANGASLRVIPTHELAAFFEQHPHLPESELPVCREVARKLGFLPPAKKRRS